MRIGVWHHVCQPATEAFVGRRVPAPCGKIAQSPDALVSRKTVDAQMAGLVMKVSSTALLPRTLVSIREPGCRREVR
jgi:hypothetical protein